MNKYFYWILSAFIGLTIGITVFSTNMTIKLIGIVITTIIILYYRKQIQEIFLETEADKVVALLVIAVFGVGLIIIDSLQKTEWQLVLLWGAWLIFSIIMLGRLSILISDYK